MTTKTCKIHGVLTEDRVYVRKRKGRTDYECRDCNNARLRGRYVVHSAEVNARNNAAYAANREGLLEKRAEHYKAHSDEIQTRTRAYKLALKIEVLTHYSGGKPRCARCPVDEVRFLALDHIKNDGAVHRLRDGVRHSFLWARKNGFPPVFQVLCHNCNTRKHAELRGPVKDSPSARHWVKARIDVLHHYSGGVVRCALCTESDVVVLTVDHVDGDGNEHRRSLASPSRLYSWLRRSGFPTGFRVLCQNHNLGAHCLG